MEHIKIKVSNIPIKLCDFFSLSECNKKKKNIIETIKQKNQDFPVSKVNKTKGKASKNPRNELKYKMSCKTGINENITIPPRENSNIFLGTCTTGRCLLGTRSRIKLPISMA